MKRAAVTRRKASQSPRRAPRPSPRAAEAKKHQDELLDEALQETFPASDAIAVDPVETMTPTGRRRRRERAQ
jgi:hypothetical protein